MIRVVLDADVLVSAALASDPAAPSVRAFDALLAERIEAVGCPALLAEVAFALDRDRLRRYLSIEEAHRFVADLPPPISAPPVRRTTSDRPRMSSASSSGSVRGLPDCIGRLSAAAG